MKFSDIQSALAAAGKPVSEPQLYRYLRNFKLTPGIKLRPQIYPADTAERILAHLGLTPSPGFGATGAPAPVLPPPLDTAAARLGLPRQRLISKREISRARHLAKKGGRK